MSEVMTLLIGESGTGKSNFAATFPDPVLFEDLECKESALLPERRKKIEEGGGEIHEFQEAVLPEALKMHLRDESNIKGEPSAYRDLIAELIELCRGNKKWGTIVLDSWTWFNKIASNELLSLKNRLGLPNSLEDYGILFAKFEEFLPFLSTLPCNHLVMTAHSAVTKDELTGKLYMSAHSRGQKIRGIVPQPFSNVFLTYVSSGGKESPQYMARTRPWRLFTFGKTIWPFLPQAIPQDFRRVEERIKEKGGDWEA